MALRYKADPIFYSNRAACYANLGQNERVVQDCNDALKLDPVYVKALNRRAHAFEKLDNLENALYGKNEKIQEHRKKEHVLNYINRFHLCLYS